MNDYLKKFKLVMPTYLLVMVGTVFAMALIRWLFTIQFSIIDIKIEIWEFLVPFILSWIVIHFLLKPKFKNLKIRNDAIGRKIEILCIVPWFILFIILALSQCYISTDSGKLEEVKNIEQVEQNRTAKYYKIENFVVDTSSIRAWVDNRCRGRFCNELSIIIYFVYPFNDAEKETSITKYYGISFHYSLDNKQTDEGKEADYEVLWKESLRKLKEYDFYDQNQFERIEMSNQYQNYCHAVNNKSVKKIKNPIILVPLKESYETRNGDKLLWIFIVFGIGSVLFLLLLLWPDYDKENHCFHKNVFPLIGNDELKEKDKLIPEVSRKISSPK